MDTVVDEIQFLASTSGSDSFGFSFTRDSGIQDFGSSTLQGSFTRTSDLGVNAMD